MLCYLFEFIYVLSVLIYIVIYLRVTVMLIAKSLRSSSMFRLEHVCYISMFELLAFFDKKIGSREQNFGLPPRKKS